jgi:putative redox protein
MEEIEVKFTSDSIKLRGEIYIPEKGEIYYPAVCLCHGIPDSVYNPQDRGWQELAKRFCDAGFITMIFKFRGAGDSEGDFDIAGWGNDLFMAVELIERLPEVDPGKIFLLGSSAGANISIYTAARDRRVAGVVSMACPAEYKFIDMNQGEAALQHFRKLGIIRDENFPPSIDDWFNSFDEVAAVNWISRISPRPLLIIHGDKDEVVPVQDAEKLFELAKRPKELVIIPGAGHRLRMEEEAVKTAINWLQKKAGLIPA